MTVHADIQEVASSSSGQDLCLASSETMQRTGIRCMPDERTTCTAWVGVGANEIMRWVEERRKRRNRSRRSRDKPSHTLDSQSLSQSLNVGSSPVVDSGRTRRAIHFCHTRNKTCQDLCRKQRPAYLFFFWTLLAVL